MAQRFFFPVIVGSLLLATGSIWLRQVSLIVPEPYLDEVFHIPQAQAYCEGKWHIWDPKITTPPGLYLIAQVLGPITKYFSTSGCDTFSLRLQNCFAVVVAIPIVAGRLHKLLQSQADSRGAGKPATNSPGGGRASYFTVHTALNVALFPPLFFFSTLYYTDPWSVFWVLLAHPVLCSSGASRWRALLGNSILFATGILALLFRQTNIFWVTVFYGGLNIVQRLESMSTQPAAMNAKVLTFQDVATRSWKSGYIYDPLVCEAWFEDYLKATLSLFLAALGNIRPVLLTTIPYLALLGTFGAFTLWNGGVVLGDKSNHVASLHLSQILYIWPYIIFFSFPLVYPYVAKALPEGTVSRLLGFSNSPIRIRPRLSIALAFAGFMLCTVHFNTIVHPFLLADNRHYMFYVFRWFLLRHPATKYFAVPVYLVCGWTAITALGGAQVPADNNARTKTLREKGGGGNKLATTRSNKVSFVIVWLAATALSLVTAPLVEPRYFILPWVMWRLYLPNSVFLAERASNEKGSRSGTLAYLKSILDCGFRNRVWIETAWFLLVNFLTMYAFLYRGFNWHQEPGNVQRFMW
ncbi:MAG: glucosyltransferase [Geoglossum umbratile]|nr:MAG: glucosyltransferase [Geoglossum umbratile]